jgi:hypothetical protein
MEDKISGQVQVDLLSNGNVRTVFFASNTGGNSSPVISKNLDVAEGDWVTTFGLTPTAAAALRAELERNKTASAETSINLELAATLCVPRFAGA